MRLRLDRNTANPQSKLVAICVECAQHGHGGVIGETPEDINSVGQLAHETVWGGHAKSLGHHIDVVDHQRQGKIVFEIDGSKRSSPPKYCRPVYKRTNSRN